MAANHIIEVWIFGTEVGKLGYDPDLRKCYFQYSPAFFESRPYPHLFPFIFRHVKPVQVFSEYEGETFKGLPPMIADSLPDMFGNIIFKEWFEANNKGFDRITPLEQLAYVANRGMGALEYRPVAEIPKTGSVNIGEVVNILRKVLDVKKDTTGKNLSHPALLNIFKIGTSAGGARPKILISEHKQTGVIIPGDIEYSNEYNHWLVKLCLDETDGYNKEIVEYSYYLLAQKAGMEMMPSKLIEDKHFATLRYDRQDGKKLHVLTASGLTGWDFMKPENSSCENLFRLAISLKVPHHDLNSLFRRMVFNTVFANYDDHLKNHSFIYNEDTDSWRLGPAYDLTYPFSLRLNYLKKSRALSINGKRTGITLQDLLAVAEAFAIKNPKGIIAEVQGAIAEWEAITQNLDIPQFVTEGIRKEFRVFEI